MNQKTVPTCCLGGPRNSVFDRCSRIQTTTPTNRKNENVTNHISTVKGFKKDHAFGFISLVGITITRPDSKYGWVKSKTTDLLVTIVMSPTAASYVWVL